MFGITIDYGPFGFMENFDMNFTPNSSDSGGRYAFCEQLQVHHFVRQTMKFCSVQSWKLWQSKLNFFFLADSPLELDEAGDGS